MTEEDTITAMLLVTHRVIHTPVPGEGYRYPNGPADEEEQPILLSAIHKACAQ
jgi:hypothetical protein